MTANKGTKDNPYRIAPSDLTFLWDECKRCFYLKVAAGIRRPAAPFPGTFIKMDTAQRKFFDGRRSSEISDQLPDGDVLTSGLSVSSRPIHVPGTPVWVTFNGALDCVVVCDSNGLAILDFKTATPSEEKAVFYARQMHSYALAKEHPAAPGAEASSVTALGLFFFEPTELLRLDDGDYAFRAPATYVPVERDDKAFFTFLREVATVLADPNPPEADGRCEYCELRSLRAPARRRLLEDASEGMLTFRANRVEFYASLSPSEFDADLAEIAELVRCCR